MKEIPLTKGLVAFVDDEDFERLNRFKWTAQEQGKAGDFYAYRFEATGKGKRRKIYLHRLIAGEPKVLKVDHRDHNGLNCQKENLRHATNQQNSWNRRPSINSRGVSWDKRTGSWFSGICFNRKTIFLGRFKEKENAISAYRKAAKKYFGQFCGAI